MTTQEIQARPIRFTGAELIALVGLVDNEAAREVLRRLRLDVGTDELTAMRFGMSSLIARGLVIVDGELVSSTEEGTVVASVLGGAHSFGEVGLVAESQSEGALLVVSDRGTLLLGAAEGDTYECISIQPDANIGELLTAMVFAFLDGHDIAAAAVTISRSAQTTRAAVRRRTGELWEVAAGELDDEGKLPVLGSGRARSRATLRALWDSAGLARE